MGVAKLTLLKQAVNVPSRPYTSRGMLLLYVGVMIAYLVFTFFIELYVLHRTVFQVGITKESTPQIVWNLGSKI